MTTQTLQTLRESLPPALRRGQVVEVFRSCGLGGMRKFKELRAEKKITPLTGLCGAKQDRYGKDYILKLCAEALSINVKQ